jgi:hypothetical protein
MRPLLLGLIAACGTSHAVPPAPRPAFSPHDLMADLSILEDAYRALHPGLFRYTTPAQLDELFASTRRAFAQPRTLDQAFVELTRLTAALRCGHSYPNPSNQPPEVAKALFERPRVPFLFEWHAGAMVITRDFTHRAELTPGVRIEALGGIPAATVLARLVPLARADGHNDAKRVAYLAVTGESTHEAFDILAPWVVPELFDRAALSLTVRGLDGRTTTLSVPFQSASERAAAIAVPDPSPDAPCGRSSGRALSRTSRWRAGSRTTRSATGSKTSPRSWTT